MSLTTKIIGVMRFSVLSPTYFSERFENLAMTAAHIYSAERMALRFHIFEHLVLPSLLAQTDPDFHLVILSGEAMPDEYKASLAELLKEFCEMQCPKYDLPMRAEILGRVKRDE